MSNLQDLQKIAQAMVAPGKGILAADESTPTIGKRFATINTESTEDSRRTYREMLFSADGIEKYIGGVIMYDETLRQSSKDGVAFPKLLADKGIVPGIKVDMGAKDLAGFAGEKWTQGLTNLRERLAEYYELGARFAKWRAVITIGDNIPSRHCLEVNAQALAAYAALCQEAGIVPIVEPEVLMDADNSQATCEKVTAEMLSLTFRELHNHGVALEGIVLKPNMVISGKGHAKQSTVDQVAEATVRVLKRYVPAAVPGIAFLSGGQSSVDATKHLDAMNKLGGSPWALTFSYGRALQADALQAWQGKDENLAAGQAAMMKRAKLNGLAAKGEYSADLE
ncbi:MAG: fructose-bisphosphate aldolase class I [Gammaproteobacteria bacterium]|nr:fructose-bisphosphate aldolase class I [Gammaproteobacteria bacterium]NNC97445.1 fructose-bisphosphate aldolase class I [Gammaproteobacteria bacterium]NNM13918.1 fructose-bisphosphate aldolase class I [Gammaproteobacteria bacterium]